MGLFDPPYKNMLKKVPVHGQFEADVIETFVQSQMDGWDHHTINHAKGVVISVWLCNAAAAGKFELRDQEYRLVKNLGGTSYNFLSPAAKDAVDGLLQHLKSREMI